MGLAYLWVQKSVFFLFRGYLIRGLANFGFDYLAFVYFPDQIIKESTLSMGCHSDSMRNFTLPIFDMGARPTLSVNSYGFGTAPTRRLTFKRISGIF